jgi:hypothetical protein
LVRRYLRADRKGEGEEKGMEGEGFGLEEGEGFGLEEAEEATAGEELTLDVDATIIEADKGVIEADKGNGQTTYDGTVGCHPMLGFLSDGRRRPCCSHVQFRPGSVQAGECLRAGRH